MKTFAVLVGMALVATLALPRAAWPQEATEPALKAAFLYNFARFTRWPAAELGGDEPIDLCIADAAVAAALSPMVAGKLVNGRLLVVEPLESDGTLARPQRRPWQLSWCEMFYAGQSTPAAEQAAFTELAGESVLTIGDREGFLRSGGIVRFFVERGRLRFEVNPAAAQRANLQISAQLLKLARIVKD